RSLRRGHWSCESCVLPPVAKQLSNLYDPTNPIVPCFQNPGDSPGAAACQACIPRGSEWALGSLPEVYAKNMSGFCLGKRPFSGHFSASPQPGCADRFRPCGSIISQEGSIRS